MRLQEPVRRSGDIIVRAMEGAGRSKLFHAIVVAGAGLVGACSKSPSNRHDASVDRAVEAAADTGIDSDRMDAVFAKIDTSAPDVSCSCPTEGGVICCTCFCDTREPVDGGACYPCYI